MESLDPGLSLPNLDQWFSNLSGYENDLEQSIKRRCYSLEGPCFTHTLVVAQVLLSR